jgi:LysR family transcriptional regulator, glycine cleavage system transcriptional activator
MNLPPLYAVLCFSAVGRKSSVKMAAEELHVSPAAVSQQIAKLEKTLGIQLLIRSTRRVELTEAGRTYLREVEPALRRIAEATQRVTRKPERLAVTVSCTVGFAMQWLLPRLPGFQALEPGVDVRINTTNRLVNLLTEEIDFAVRHGSGTYPGLEVERLINDRLHPVCSPALLPEGARLTSPADLADFPLLHDEHRRDWAMWLRSVGADNIDPDRGPIFVESKGAIDAAVAGQGIALMRKSMVRDELSSGKFIIPFDTPIDTPIAYYLVYDSTVLLQKHNERFRKWIVAQADADRREFS